jgi:2-C-methyl-D-erythritol 2,4-cyclodiphosphate synthase
VRIGQGFDAHRFDADERESRALVLGGVPIPAAPPLAGHSDADVVLHAIADALLGAAALGDLGALFGTDDPRFAGADSAVFVREALRRLVGAGWRVGNLDCTVVAQRPRLAEHLPVMRERVAALLDASAEAVSVKATSTDGMGFAGRGEGVACLAIVLLVPAP